MRARGCHATVRIAVGGYSEDRQIDMEALYRDKPNADTIDQVMWNLRPCDADGSGCRLTHSRRTSRLRFQGMTVTAFGGQTGLVCRSARLRLSATLPGAQ